MKAKDISGAAPGGKRTVLAEVLPLRTPFVVQIFPIYACNFKCRYCIFCLEKERRGFISDTVVMDPVLFRKCVDDLARFPDRIKVLRFVGIGEPLLHKDLAAMIAYAVEKQVAHVVELLTNGALLTPTAADALLAAGLSRLVVSLQGTSREKYQSICGTDIDFDQFVANLRYFYRHRGAAQVYIKIIDCALDGPADEQRFREIFGDLCDTIAIEHAVPIHSGVDYGEILHDQKEVTQFGLPAREVTVCPQPFFTMQVNPDGKVVPCYSFEYPEIMGDCHEESLQEIWNGAVFQRFRRRMLDGSAALCETCAHCSIIKYRIFPEDTLSREDAERLKPDFEP